MTSKPIIKLDQLDSRIRSVWARNQRLHFFAGLLTFFKWSIPLFLAAVFIDWITYMPTPGRIILLLILLAVSSYRAWFTGWRHLQAFDVRRTALQLESHHGNLNSLLISALQFRQKTIESGEANVLYNRTYKLAEEAAAEMKPQEAVPFSPLKKPGTVVSVLCALIIVLTLSKTTFMNAGLLRIFCPWVAIEYPTDTEISLQQDELIVKEGDSALIQANLTGIIPEDATILISTGKGSPREIELEVTDNKCTYSIASASRDFTYRILAGDDRTDWHTVNVIPAPRVKSVNIEVDFPEYINRKNESIEALTLNVPEGSSLKWNVTLDRPISSAVFISDGEDPVDLDVSEGGRKVTFSKAVLASSGYNFSWVEKENGFKFTSPRYYLQVDSDKSPRVELTYPESNLVAMIGRPLKVTARYQDDHGIGSNKLTYRLNQFKETVVELKAPSQGQKGDQPVDWDYTTAVPGLKIGDTLSFSLKVSDRYPGENGPHIARSETRRVTFLSREDYLKQIQKKKDLLLSRVQTIYRQQRSAFENVRSLDPDSENYMQTCQIEAIRQELVREQIREISLKLQSLIDDLAANNVSDAPEGESLVLIRSALLDIADTHLANAASRLRHQSSLTGKDSKESPNPLAASRVVNTAARELGSLVLLRSIDTALEVYARESRMLAQVQASIRWRTVQGGSTSLAKEQIELAQWTNRLLTDLENGMHYEKRPLAVLRLIRSIKNLQGKKTEELMRQASALITQKEPAKAEIIQTELISILLDAEFSVRLSGAYTTLIKTRDQVRMIVKDQTELRKNCSSMNTDAFKSGKAQAVNEQNKLRKQLVTLLLPTVPAPRTTLSDETIPEPPPVKSILKDADNAMVNALKELTSGNQQEAVKYQNQTEQSLTKLLSLVERWSVDLGLQTLGLSTVVAASSERLGFIENYEAKVVALLEKVDIAASENQKVNGLVEPQVLLTEEMAAFNSDLIKHNESNPDKDIPPLLSRTKQAEKIMRQAVEALKANKADEAMALQEQTADILAEAFELVTRQNEELGYLQSLMLFQRSVGFANGYMEDIVSQQRDLLKATQEIKEKDFANLKPKLKNLKSCVEEVAPLLDLVASRLDVGSPLAFASTDLEDAVISFESGDRADSIDAQDVATESLADVQKLVKAIKSETGYISEIVESLHNSVAETTSLEYQQIELKRQLKSIKNEDLNALVKKQNELLHKAETHSKALISITGMEGQDDAVKLIAESLTKLKANDKTTALEQMDLASAKLKENAESLFIAITMLHGLPNIDMSLHTEPDVKRLVNVMSVASSHTKLFRIANKADGGTLKELSSEQGELLKRCKELYNTGEPHALLKASAEQLHTATLALQSTDRGVIKASQRAAIKSMRHFIIEQAIILETAVPPSPPVDGSPEASGPGSDSESEFSAGFIADFVSGEAPKDQRSGWNVRADRNRAALNQNFARELPLEYRGLLKNYYERVTK